MECEASFFSRERTEVFSKVRRDEEEGGRVMEKEGVAPLISHTDANVPQNIPR